MIQSIRYFIQNFKKLSQSKYSLTSLTPARIEKDYHHVKSNIASQREKTTENYRREYEKAKVRQSDLNKQLENMEERFKVNLSSTLKKF